MSNGSHRWSVSLAKNGTSADGRLNAWTFRTWLQPWMSIMIAVTYQHITQKLRVLQNGILACSEEAEVFGVEPFLYLWASLCRMWKVVPSCLAKFIYVQIYLSRAWVVCWSTLILEVVLERICMSFSAMCQGPKWKTWAALSPHCCL